MNAPQGAGRKQFWTLSLEAFHGSSALSLSGGHYQVPYPPLWLGRVELNPTSPDSGRPAHLAGEGPAGTGSSPPGAWFVFLDLAVSSHNVERIGKEKPSSGSRAPCL